ncbi:hypothetical protein J6590_046521 [Homalodisca vitripennis]|nr:hypothetical protein J6590_046521 [Homalodisca vitripennis]
MPQVEAFKTMRIPKQCHRSLTLPHKIYGLYLYSYNYRVSHCSYLIRHGTDSIPRVKAFKAVRIEQNNGTFYSCCCIMDVTLMTRAGAEPGVVIQYRVATWWCDPQVKQLTVRAGTISPASLAASRRAMPPCRNPGLAYQWIYRCFHKRALDLTDVMLQVPEPRTRVSVELQMLPQMCIRLDCRHVASAGTQD